MSSRSLTGWRCSRRLCLRARGPSGRYPEKEGGGFIHPVRFCPAGETPPCTYVTILSRYRGQWVFSRHRERDTWETQGGHIEPGESMEAAARRELYEESGGLASSLTPLCGYWVDRPDRETPRYGLLFLAELSRLEPLPASEMAEVTLADGLPDRLTYPGITPLLFAYAKGYLHGREDQR